MDGWQKLEVLSKVVAAIFIPIAVVALGNQLAAANKQRDAETKFVEIASAILSKEPGPNQSAESRSLRRWAVSVIDRFSGVPMPEATADALVQTTALPMPEAANTSESPDSSATWAVVFGGDTTLDAAKHEITITANKMGLANSAIFRRAGSFRSVKIFPNRSEAEDALGKAHAIRQDAYVVNMLKWCPSSTERVGYFECGVP